MLSVLDNSLLQGLGYGLAGIGVVLTFRILRYPDLTADGSFLLGATVFAALLSGQYGWPAALAAAMVSGAAAGVVTGVISERAGVNRLLAGILTTMIAYSIAFHVLSSRSNVSLIDQLTPFTAAERLDARFVDLSIHPFSVLSSAVVAILVGLVLIVVLRSDLGLSLRGSGDNPLLARALGRSPECWTYLALAIGNSLIALAGALVTSRQGFADVNMGAGIVIVLIAGLLIGEDAVRWFRLEPRNSMVVRVATPVVGACLYFLLYLAVLRASSVGLVPFQIQPTDLKLLSALVLIVTIGKRRSKVTRSADEAFPF